MELRELIEEKIIPTHSDKEDKKFKRMLKLVGKKEREALLNKINRVRRSEGLHPFSTSSLKANLKEPISISGALRQDLRNFRDKINFYDLPPFAADRARVEAHRKKVDKKEIEKKQEKSTTSEWDREAEKKRTIPQKGDLIVYKNKEGKKAEGKVIANNISFIVIDTFSSGHIDIKPSDIVKIIGHKMSKRSIKGKGSIVQFKSGKNVKQGRVLKINPSGVWVTFPGSERKELFVPYTKILEIVR